MRTLRKRKACERTIVVPIHLRLRLNKDEGGWYVVSCKQLRGLITQGRTIRKALANGREAAKLIIDVMLGDWNKFKPKHK